MSTSLRLPVLRQALLVLAASLLSWASAQAQAPIVATVGTGTASASTNALLSTSTTINKYARTISIYSAAELTAAGAQPGTIVSIAWYKDGTGEYPTADAQLSVYLKSTATSTLAVNPVDWATEVVGATPVYTNTALALPTGTGFKTFVLATPFVWNGADNVEVLVDWFRNSTPTADIRWQYTAVGTTGIHATQVNSMPLPTARFASNRPNVQFGISASGVPICSPPTNVVASAITSTGLSVAFTAPTPVPASYTITYTPAGGAPQTQTATASPVTLSGLTPSTTYTVRVVANCASGNSSAAASATVTTPSNCLPPTALAFTSTSATAGNLTFTPAAGVPAGTTYQITYTGAGGATQTITAATSPAVLTGMIPSTTYTLSIRSICSPTLTSATTATLTFATPLSRRESREAALVQLYPNPAQRSLHISVPTELSTRPVPVTVLNSLGQAVQQHVLPITSAGAQAALDISQLAPGLYTLRLQTGATAITKHVVVQ